jgi:hypothetical protein
MPGSGVVLVGHSSYLFVLFCNGIMYLFLKAKPKKVNYNKRIEKNEKDKD